MRPPKILVIDDDAITRGVVTEVLKEQGYEVVTAWNGGLGMGMAEREKPDLVILDVYMPGKDGFTALAELRAETKTWRTPVLMLTSEDRLKNVEKAFDIGADAYLTKPCNPVLLQKKVAELLATVNPRPAPRGLIN